jgi:hypothetical protein
MNTLCNYLIAAAIALAISSAYMLDDPSDHEAAQDVAAELREREACGENGAAMWLTDGRIQCLTKRGRKTGEPK